MCYKLSVWIELSESSYNGCSDMENEVCLSEELEIELGDLNLQVGKYFFYKDISSEISDEIIKKLVKEVRNLIKLDEKYQQILWPYISDEKIVESISKDFEVYEE